MQETSTRIPNLVFCQDEMGREWSFSGPNTAKEFCDWFLVDERPTYYMYCSQHARI